MTSTPIELGHVGDPGAIEMLHGQIGSGERDPRELLTQYLGRIGRTEPEVMAWRQIDRAGAFQQAEVLAHEARNGHLRSPLHGLPMAVKDVIDVAGYTTIAGCRARDSAPPATLDAEVVAAARAAGVIVLGKAQTTELAYFTGPPPTRNPWNPQHTPGGSSAGSAAAVAAGMVPLSIGTQTAGSVVRPAAYCGIAAFKPTTLAAPSYGLLPFAPSFDTVGYFGYRMADAATVAETLLPDWLTRSGQRPVPPRLRSLGDELLHDASDETRASVDTAVVKLADAGIDVAHAHTPVSLRNILDAHRIIAHYELARAHAGLLTHSRELVGAELCNAMAHGASIAESEYELVRGRLQAMRRAFWQTFSDVDALLFPAATTTAPAGMATGDPSFIIPFSALGGPIATIPVGVGATGLPLGLMLIGRPGLDGVLLKISREIASIIEMGRLPALA